VDCSGFGTNLGNERTIQHHPSTDSALIGEDFYRPVAYTETPMPYWKCMECNKRFESKRKHSRHMKAAHPRSEWL